jgi:hypothetical protein
MFSRRVVALTLIAIGCTSCSASSPGAAEPVSTPLTTVQAQPGLSVAVLKRSLLQVTDLPTGFAAEPRIEGAKNVHPCNAKFTEPAYVGVEACYSAGGLTGPYLLERLRSYKEGATSAAAYLADLDRAIAACRTFAGQDGAQVNIAPLSFPKLGEQTVAFRITDGSGIALDDVFIRVRATVIAVGYGGLGTDTRETQRYAQLGLRKLQDSK